MTAVAKTSAALARAASRCATGSGADLALGADGARNIQRWHHTQLGDGTPAVLSDDLAVAGAILAVWARVRRCTLNRLRRLVFR